MHRARVRGLRSFSLISGLERRWAGSFGRRALAREGAAVDASPRGRGLNRSLAQVRFRCQQLRLCSIDVLLYRLSRQSHTEVRRDDTSGSCGAIAVLRNTRALTLAASKEQQESRNKKPYQGERRRHCYRKLPNECSSRQWCTSAHAGDNLILPAQCAKKLACPKRGRPRAGVQSKSLI